jgi:hypothetical protein
MNLSLEKRIKRTAIIGLVTTGMFLAGNNLPLPFSEMYLNANQISQSENKKQSQEEEFQLKKLRENRAERDKTKKEVAAKKYSLQPFNIDVLDSEGYLFQSYKNITYEQAKQLVIKVPENGYIELVNPQKIPQHIVDMMIYKNGKKLSDDSGNDIFRKRIDTLEVGLKVGDEDQLFVCDEPHKLNSSIGLRYKVIAASRPESIPEPEDERTQVAPEPVQPQPLQPEPAQQPQPAPVKTDISRIIVGGGIEDLHNKSINLDPDYRFKTFEANAHFSFANEKAFAHLNAMYNNLNNIFNSLWQENINIVNLRAGGIYNLKPLAVGAEISKSSVSQVNTDVWSPTSNPFFKYNNSDLLILGKAGLSTNFSKNAAAILVMGGVHNQSQTTEDNRQYAEFALLNQNDWNYVYGGETFIDIGRDGNSTFSLYAGGSVLYFRPLNRIVEDGAKPELMDGKTINFKVLAAVKLAKNVKLGGGVTYSTADFNYKGKASESQSRSAIKLYLSYNF